MGFSLFGGRSGTNLIVLVEAKLDLLAATIVFYEKHRVKSEGHRELGRSVIGNLPPRKKQRTRCGASYDVKPNCNYFC